MALRMSRWCGDSKIARRTAGALMRFNCDPPRRNSFSCAAQQHTRTKGKGRFACVATMLREIHDNNTRPIVVGRAIVTSG